ncbi:MAG: hypothetical protein M3173_06605, partial [Chloroflexota bacterium]|nr:hypothetical protein [Chloroflexota bacterium]
VEPLSVPTAEFDPFGLDEPRRPVLSLGSVYRSGPHPPVPAGVEVLTLRDAPIVALSNEDLGLPSETTLADVLKSHVKLVIPLGGVVWDFARENAPGIEIGARSRAHLLIHDLNYGLRCLAARTPRRGVMLVHGIEEAILNGSPRYPVFETPHCYSLVESNDSENRALTALFFNHKAAAKRPKNVVAACEAVWQAATTIQSTTQGEDIK